MYELKDRQPMSNISVIFIMYFRSMNKKIDRDGSGVPVINKRDSTRLNEINRY